MDDLSRLHLDDEKRKKRTEEEISDLVWKENNYVPKRVPFTLEYMSLM